MYSLAIYLYMFMVRLASLFNRKARLMMRGHRNTWKILRREIRPEARYVWFHAASLGEFEQGRPLMERMRREHPEKKILLTFFSPSGYEVRKNYDGADVVCYLPFDTPLNARKFVRLHTSKRPFSSNTNSGATTLTCSITKAFRVTACRASSAPNRYSSAATAGATPAC